MSLKIERLERISLYPHPVINLLVPRQWVIEAREYYEKAQESEAESGRSRLDYQISRSIAKRAFGSYFGLLSQWKDWSCKDIDYEVDYNESSTSFKIYCNPLQDYSLYIGNNLKYTIYKKKSDLVHVFCTWTLPLLTIVGCTLDSWLVNGKHIIYPKDMIPLYKHKVLNNLDKKALYS